MQNAKCRNCGSHDIRVKDIEIRHLNANTMVLRSREMVREAECKACGLVLTLPSRQPALV